jgi:bifunctional DNA-binding transcriptional regulator/antitoxin component of YhaV-PrlF toxin-antitoxin module
MRSRRLAVEQEGFLTLPADVCEAVGLQPGDILAIKANSVFFSFSLEIDRELHR